MIRLLLLLVAGLIVLVSAVGACRPGLAPGEAPSTPTPPLAKQSDAAAPTAQPTSTTPAVPSVTAAVVQPSPSVGTKPTPAPIATATQVAGASSAPAHMVPQGGGLARAIAAVQACLDAVQKRDRAAFDSAFTAQARATVAPQIWEIPTEVKNYTLSLDEYPVVSGSEKSILIRIVKNITDKDGTQRQVHADLRVIEAGGRFLIDDIEAATADLPEPATYLPVEGSKVMAHEWHVDGSQNDVQMVSAVVSNVALVSTVTMLPAANRAIVQHFVGRSDGVYQVADDDPATSQLWLPGDLRIGKSWTVAGVTRTVKSIGSDCGVGVASVIRCLVVESDLKGVGMLVLSYYAPRVGEVRVEDAKTGQMLKQLTGLDRLDPQLAKSTVQRYAPNAGKVRR